MERVRKTFFNPLATSKAQIRDILKELPVGSAHPFSSERIILCRTENGIEEIDISSYPEDFFFNALDLGEMGEVLLRRMAAFKSHLQKFEDFQIMQAPASTFKIPMVSGQITILALSERTPTYYDFCFADASCNTCCWLARNTFEGISHSGDILNGKDLLDYISIDKDTFTDKEICVFISGYQIIQINRFLGTYPALLVADHVDKILYIIPVPLDKATIGDATICCPLVIKRDGDSLICSILPKATTDRGMMCNSKTLISPCFPEAIQRADFTITSPHPTARPDELSESLTAIEDTSLTSDRLREVFAKETAVFTTNPTTLPSFLDLKKTQIINFGTGIEFQLPEKGHLKIEQLSTVVLPCIFGSQLQGPVLLATGKLPSNVPFLDERALLDYYEQLKNAVVIVDDQMTDNARNLATSYRLNALFVVQISPEKEPNNTDDLESLLNSVNINAVTALAGPQSLVLIQISEKYYFYRGIANRAYLNTSGLAFGSDVTSIIESAGMEPIIDPRAKRIVNLDNTNEIILPTSGQMVQPQDLAKLLEDLPIDKIKEMEDDISALVPQLQVTLNQKDVQILSQSLVSVLSAKVDSVVSPLRRAYVEFLTQNYKTTDPELMKKKNGMLGHLKKVTKDTQKALEPVISNFSNLISSQTTSKRTHDLQRLVRQTKIQGNVEAVKSMTFDTLSGYLETYAGDMGVMLLNIETMPYNQLLGNLKNTAIDASPCCDLDSRVLHLEGFDAGIIIEQSQSNHDGPLRNEAGPLHPILALPYLSQGRGTGSMLAWVCWDEFVNLESPYSVRWMEKCNDAHIAALRIIMRSTLSNAVASREHNLQPGSLETGQLMSALLMAAMSKLAAMRTTAPVVVDKAEDTVTKLMRGLFGNLLTIAGSGVRPLSMVWQLFGLNPQLDLPANKADWIWYENVVALYPYSGWPLEQFYENLEKLLDKIIIRVVTKNERVAKIKSSRVAEMIKCCVERNIQLDHSRTIITIFMRMFTTENADIAAIAKRLSDQLPSNIKRHTPSYSRMIKYLMHISQGGQRRLKDDLIMASVYNKRSGAFGELKTQVSEACQSKDWPKMKEACQALMEKHAESAALWHIAPESFDFQNMTPYKTLLDADFGDDIDQETENKNRHLIQRVLSDAEKARRPWQVGGKGQFSDDIEPLDEDFLSEILTGDKTKSLEITKVKPTSSSTSVIQGGQTTENGFLKFQSLLQPQFFNKMQEDISAEAVCGILNVPVNAMRVFIKALNPEFVWEDLGENFKMVILGLLQNRSNRVESAPTRRLFNMERDKKTLQAVGW